MQIINPPSSSDGQFLTNDASNASVTDIVALTHTTSGTAAAGIGAGLLCRAENAAGTTRDTARTAGLLTVATDGAEDSAYTIQVRTGGGALAEVARFTSALTTIASALTVTGGITGISSQLFDIRDYGAVGDGVTDDGPAIQLALNAACNSGGGVCYIPQTADSWRIATPIIMTFAGHNNATGVRIQGEGAAGPILCDTGPTARVFSLGVNVQGFVGYVDNLFFISPDFTHGGTQDCKEILDTGVGGNYYTVWHLTHLTAVGVFSKYALFRFGYHTSHVQWIQIMGCNSYDGSAFQPAIFLDHAIATNLADITIDEFGYFRGVSVSGNHTHSCGIGIQANDDGAHQTHVVIENLFTGQYCTKSINVDNLGISDVGDANVTIEHLTLRNIHPVNQPTSGVGGGCITVKRCNHLEVDDAYIIAENFGNRCFDLYSVKAAKFNHLSFINTASAVTTVIKADSACGTLDLYESELDNAGSGSLFILDSSAAVTRRWIGGTCTTSVASIGTSQTVNQTWNNLTPALTGAQQYSPMTVRGGQGFASSGSLSKAVEFGEQVVPIQGTSAPTGKQVLQHRIDGGSWVTDVSFDSAGGITAVGNIAGVNGTFSGPVSGIGANTFSATAGGVPLNANANYSIGTQALGLNLSLSRSGTTPLFYVGVNGDAGDSYMVYAAGAGQVYTANYYGSQITQLGYAVGGSIAAGHVALKLLAGTNTGNITAGTTGPFGFDCDTSHTVLRATGDVTEHLENVFRAPTLSFAGSSTILDAATLTITGAPVLGTNAIFTNALALWVKNGISRFDSDGTLTGSLQLHNTETPDNTFRDKQPSPLLFSGKQKNNSSVVPITATVTMESAASAGDSAGSVSLVFSAQSTEMLRLKYTAGTGVKIGMYGAGAVVQQAIGATVTNNIASGGTTAQLDDFTGSVWATDSTAVRNDLYQLGDMVRQIQAGLKLLGALKT